MKTTLQAWGHSQGIRIPKTCLSTVGWHVGDELEMKIDKGAISLAPAKRPVRGRFKIEELIRRMPKEYRVQEVDTGRPVGREIW